jgi:FMN-dependent NADH-azoreductase
MPGASLVGAQLERNAYPDEVIATDILVIGAPMYNFSIPTPLT